MQVQRQLFEKSSLPIVNHFRSHAVTMKSEVSPATIFLLCIEELTSLYAFMQSRIQKDPVPPIQNHSLAYRVRRAFKALKNFLRFWVRLYLQQRSQVEPIQPQFSLFSSPLHFHRSIIHLSQG